MPIYEYECESCGSIEEAFQRISDRPLRKCSTCSGKLHKLISQSSFHLKGTGWYVTDYASKKNKKSKPSKTESGKKESSSASTKPEKTAAPAKSSSE